MRVYKRLLMGFLCAVLLFSTAFSSMCFSVEAADYKTGYVNDPLDNCLRLRKGAGTSYAVIAELQHGTILKIISEKEVSGIVWYKVKCTVDGKETEGYVSSEYVIVVPDSEEDFASELASLGFPESYLDSLKILHSVYPQWKFIAVNTGLDWETAVNKESEIGKSLVPYSWDKEYINTSDVDENGNQIGRDGANWVSASKAAVAYYMDPRNSLSVPYIFQFEVLSYNSDIHVKEGVKNILKDSFMKGSFTVGEKTYNYANTFMKAADVSGVSPYHLAARVLQEQGATGTTLSDGKVSGYKGYYNFFNIGAYTTSGASASVNGAKYAKKVGEDYYGPWTSPYRSILGGAVILGESYIKDGQDTLYFQKFNVVTKPYFDHQYMTNIAAARSESFSFKSAYSDDMLKEALVFEIPVYENMPAAPVPLPTDAAQNESDNSQSSEAKPKYSSSEYKIKNGVIQNIKVGTKVKELLAGVKVTNGSAVLLNSSGAAKTSGKVCTGDVIQIKYKSGSRVYKNINVAVTGDVNGDGKISLMDLMLVKKQLLGTKDLSKAEKAAADVSKKGTVDLMDLMMIQKHLLGTYKITQ